MQDLSYRYEDREDPLVALGTALVTDDPLETLATGDAAELAKYHDDRYFAGLGLSYRFWQFYAANINYSFNKLESDRIGEGYDEHRVLLSLSWEKDILRW